MAINRIMLLGRLTRDPEQRQTVTGKTVTTFTLAADRNYRGKDGAQQATDFIDVVAWDKAGEAIARYVRKGDRLYVEGRLQVRAYESRTGERRRVAEVIASRFEFVETKASRAARQEGSAPQESQAGQGQAQAKDAGYYGFTPQDGQANNTQEGFGKPLFVDDEIPF